MISSRSLFRIIAIALLLSFVSASAQAHPHVWINYDVKVISSKDGLTRMRFVWHLDAMFTEMVQQEFKLKTITEKDSAFIKSHAFDNLKGFHYFIDATVDGKPFIPDKVHDFTAHMEGKALVYQFTIDLPQPAQSLELSLYDPEFYVDIEPPMQKIDSDKGTSMMATAHYEPKPFITVDAENGGKAPLCSGHDGKARESTWGEFPVYVVSCSVAH